MISRWAIYKGSEKFRKGERMILATEIDALKEQDSKRW
jgi:hypothetical protein